MFNIYKWSLTWLYYFKIWIPKKPQSDQIVDKFDLKYWVLDLDSDLFSDLFLISKNIWILQN